MPQMFTWVFGYIEWIYELIWWIRSIENSEPIQVEALDAL